MNMINKRKRGRPVGTCLDDNPTLNKMADLIVAHPTMRPTTACRRALGAVGPSIIRRIQVKWKANATEFLAQARVRASVEESGARFVNTKNVDAILRRDAERRQMMIDFIISGSTRESQKLASQFAVSNAVRALNATSRSLAFEATLGASESLVSKAIREAVDSPAMRVMREMEASPVMRAARGLPRIDTPITRLARGDEAIGSFLHNAILGRRR